MNEVVRKYPNLKINQDRNGISFLKGILDIPNDEDKFVGSFLIEVHFSAGFPYRFPILFEAGGIIPNEADWHKYKDESCCITVKPDEILKCKNGISVLLFIEKYGVSYFANYIYRKLTGKYKNGDYAHNSKGVFQFYEALFKTGNTKLWVQYFKNIFRNLKVECGRNNICFCGSEKKYKYCHLEIFNTLILIGEEQVISDFKQILK